MKLRIIKSKVGYKIQEYSWFRWKTWGSYEYDELGVYWNDSFFKSISEAEQYIEDKILGEIEYPVKYLTIKLNKTHDKR